MASEVFESVGYTVLTAASGEEVLEIFQAQECRIDLVLLDLGMPGMGGEKCLELLMEQYPAQKVIVASGYATDPVLAN